MSKKLFVFVFISFNFFSQLNSQSKFIEEIVDSTFNFPDSTLIVRNIYFMGNKITKAYTIEKEMSLKRDSLLTFNKLEFDNNRIYSLQLFNIVKIKVKQDSIFADLTVEVVEQFYFFVFPVFGFKDRDASHFFYGAGVMYRNINGEAENFSIRTAYGYDPFITLSYESPYFKRENDVFLDASLISNMYLNKSMATLEEDEKNYYERWNSINITIGKRVDVFNNYSFTGGFTNVFVKNNKPRRTVSKNGTDNFPWIKFTKKYDTRDLKEFATTGSHYRFEIAKFGTNKDEVDYFKLTYDGKYFFPIKEKSTIGFRTFASLVNGSRLAHYQKEYFGYEMRLRGHYQIIHEGENLIYSGLEYRTPIYGPKYFHLKNLPFEQIRDFKAAIYGTLFFDFGSVWDRNQNWKDKKMSGYGFGLNFLASYKMVIRTEVAFKTETRPIPNFIIGAGASF